MIRDRKMYVVPTPFALTVGTLGTKTLILPFEFPKDERYIEVGELIRKESTEVVVGYSFDLIANSIASQSIPNPHAGLDHKFLAYRLKTQTTRGVSMSNLNSLTIFEDFSKSD